MAAGLERIAEDFPGSLTTVERERERETIPEPDLLVRLPSKGFRLFLWPFSWLVA